MCKFPHISTTVRAFSLIAWTLTRPFLIVAARIEVLSLKLLYITARGGSIGTFFGSDNV